VTWLPLALTAAAALAIAYAGWWREAPDAASGPAPFALIESTDIGGQRNVELPDGSVIRLNTDSAVDVRFAESERRVRLVRGEAHFTVARQTTRPFIVSAAGVDVRVVGTVFNVRLRSDSVDVLVTEGKVRVAAPAGEPDKWTPADFSAAPQAGLSVGQPLSELGAGQKVSIELAPKSAPAPAAPVAVSTAEIRQTLAWQTQRLDFDATPLSEIVEEFNRYNRHKLIVPDARLNAQRFGGSFPAGDAQTFVRMLEADFGVVAERHGDETRLRLRRSE
jgi:transmembrane sensor